MKAKQLLKYRNLWMGCAMLWIVCYHMNDYIFAPPWSALASIGYGGVDICLFASGAGCYYSLFHSGCDLNYFKRRFMRIMPTYFCFITIWILFRMCTNPLKLVDIWGNFIGIQAFTGRGNFFNWYISLIMLLYCISPLFFSLAREINSKLFQGLIVVFLIALSLATLDSYIMIIVMTRVPTFYIGMLFAKYCREDADFAPGMYFVLGVGLVLGLLALVVVFQKFEYYLWPKGLYWYPFILITPGLCVAVSLFGMLAEKWRIGRLVLGFIDKAGNYSFELYLVHIFVIEVADYLISTACLLPDTKLVWCAVLVIVVIGTPVLRQLTRLISQAMGRITDKLMRKPITSNTGD